MIENIILSNLAYSEPYARKILPFIKEEYFADRCFREVFITIANYINKYNSLPTFEALEIDLSSSKNISDEEMQKSQTLIETLNVDPNLNQDWLLRETEKFCQNKALHLALMKSIEIYNGEDKKHEYGSIPQILQDALGVSFDTNIGHDFFANSEERFDWYHLPEEKVPFGIDILNDITKGGVSKKTLSILYGGVNVGKTFLMCSMAADNIRDGYNVLYITLEMSQEMISHRIDANLLDMNMDDISLMPKEQFLTNLERMQKKYCGNLIVKEFPTSQAGATNFRYLLNELKLKKNFVPDIIYIDYLNICKSSIISKGKTGLYEYVGSIGQELRGLAVEMNLPIITASQFNREGFKSSSPGLDDVSESFGTGMIADLVLGIVRSEELDRDNQIKMIQLKTRYMDKGMMPVFLVGSDIRKMKLYNVDDKEQTLSSSKKANDMAERTTNNDFVGLF